MGDLRPENGGQPPDEGGTSPGGLPDLPPEWGTIVIPDDAAELDDEADLIRRELRREHYRTLARRVLLLPNRRRGESSLIVPMIIMAVAILTTLVSLFVVTWDRTPQGGIPVSSAPASTTTAFSDLVFLDSAGHPVRIGTLLPAVVVLTDDCSSCTPLLAALVAAMPRPVHTVAVGRYAPQLPTAAAAGGAYSLADPNDLIRSRYAPNAPTGGKPNVLISDKQGTVVHVIPGASSVDEVVAAVKALPGLSLSSTSGANAPAHTQRSGIPRAPIH